MYFSIADCRFDCKINRPPVNGEINQQSVEKLAAWLDVRNLAMEAVARLPGIGEDVAGVLAAQNAQLKTDCDRAFFVEHFLAIQNSLLIFKEHGFLKMVKDNRLICSGSSPKEVVFGLNAAEFKGKRPEIKCVRYKGSELFVSGDEYKEVRERVLKKIGVATFESKPPPLQSWERCPAYPGCTNIDSPRKSAWPVVFSASRMAFFTTGANDS